jgi:hypothetical protein
MKNSVGNEEKHYEQKDRQRQSNHDVFLSYRSGL